MRELNNKKSDKDECMIINIDHSQNQGTHWTGLFIKNGISYYFDSYGFPPLDELKKYCTPPRYYNSFQIQMNNEVICGIYYIYFLYRLSNGYKFNDVLNELYKYNYK